MSVDVFGWNLVKSEGNRGPPGVGFKVTTDGHYDIENKKLCTVAEPQQPSDVVNLEIILLIRVSFHSLKRVTPYDLYDPLTRKEAFRAIDRE